MVYKLQFKSRVANKMREKPKAALGLEQKTNVAEQALDILMLTYGFKWLEISKEMKVQSTDKPAFVLATITKETLSIDPTQTIKSTPENIQEGLEYMNKRNREELEKYSGIVVTCFKMIEDRFIRMDELKITIPENIIESIGLILVKLASDIGASDQHLKEVKNTNEFMDALIKVCNDIVDTSKKGTDILAVLEKKIDDAQLQDAQRN